MNETAITLQCGTNQLLGILHKPENARNTAVLIIVGGPQYRVGSHRQFVQLSRSLAKENIISLRFDYTGMGDSQGEKKSFESISDDIRVACDRLCEEQQVEDIVLWGLCDAASAAIIYAPTDPRVVGLIILNPWLRSDAAMGKSMLKHYYLQRLMSKDFWKKFLTGKVNVASSVGDAKGFVEDTMADEKNSAESYQTRMQDGIKLYKGKVCLILSGVDLTAKEFEQQTLGNKAWDVFNSRQSQIHRLEKADHTFSSTQYKRQVESVSAAFIADLE